jgi:hypothetical protein
MLHEDTTGWTDTVEGTLSYPLIRASDNNLTLTLNLAHKTMKVKIPTSTGGSPTNTPTSPNSACNGNAGAPGEATPSTPRSPAT